MKNIPTFKEFLNESVNNGSFGDKNQFTWIYDKPFKNLTLQEQGHKSKTGFKELVIKKIEDREVKKLIDEIQYEDYLSWNIIKSIVKKYHPEFQVINESNDDLNFKSAMKEFGFKPDLEKNAFPSKDGHGNDVKILTYEDQTLKGLVYESRFGPSGTYEWSYGAWDKNGKSTEYSAMANILKSSAQDAIKHFS